MRFGLLAAAAAMAVSCLPSPASAATVYSGETNAQSFSLPGTNQPGRYRVSFWLVGPSQVDVSWTIEEAFERFVVPSFAFFDAGTEASVSQQSLGSDGLFEIFVSGPTERTDSLGPQQLIRRSAWLLRSIDFHFPELLENPVVYEVTIDRLSAIPEPATWALMIAGFGIVGVASRRRVRRSLS